MLGLQLNKILGIVGFQIEVERVFNIASICTNVQRFRLGIDNLEMLVNIYKNWPDDACVGGFPFMEKFMEMKEILMDENEDVIASLRFLELDETNTTIQVVLYGLGIGCDGS